MRTDQRRGFGAWWAAVGVACGLAAGVSLSNLGAAGPPASVAPLPAVGPPATAPPMTAVAQPGEMTMVESITDGDTLRTAGGLRVRLIGIDTPEVSGGKECYGEEAKAHLGQLVPPGTAVRLVYDQERQDRYGRDLAYVYRFRDDLHVNLAMVVDGYATTLTIKPNTAHAMEFTAAVQQAKSLSLAIWGACPPRAFG